MNKFLKRFGMAAVIGAAVLVPATVLSSCGDDDDDKVTGSVPEAFTKALQAKFPEAKNVEWERKGNYYVAEFTHNFQETDVWFGDGAQWAMTVTDYGKNLFFLPPEVEASFAESEYGYWTVDDVDFYERTDRNFYVIEVEKKGQPDTDLFYQPDGARIKAITHSTQDITPVTPI